MLFVIIGLSIFVPALIFHLLTRKYDDKSLYATLWIGKKGCGKSATIAKLCLEDSRRGKRVAVNCSDIRDIPNCYTYDVERLGKDDIKDFHVIVDEATIIFDGREFKTLSKEVRDWSAGTRHDRLRVDYFSQSYTIDKRLKDNLDRIYIGRKYFRVFTVWRQLSKFPDIRISASDAQSQIVDALEFMPIWYPQAVRITFIPKYVKYFDSFKPLKKYENKLKLYPVKMREKNPD